jgi:hypothetical protein
MATRKNTTYTVLALVTVLFVGLKLTGLVAWSWFVVFAPILPIVALIVFLLALMPFAWNSEATR